MRIMKALALVGSGAVVLQGTGCQVQDLLTQYSQLLQPYPTSGISFINLPRIIVDPIGSLWAVAGGSLEALQELVGGLGT